MTDEERCLELGKLFVEREQIVSDLAITKEKISAHARDMRKAIKCCEEVLEEKYDPSCWNISFPSYPDLRDELTNFKKKTDRIREIEQVLGI